MTTKNKTIFYVYIYLNPLKPGDYNYGDLHFDYEPFYVGKGHKGRLFRHLYDAINKLGVCTKSHKLNIIKQILKSGVSKDVLKEKFIIKIQRNMPEFCTFGMEKFLIKVIGRKDKNLGPLVNYTDGGEGSCGAIVTQESKNKKKQSWKNKSQEEMQEFKTKIKLSQNKENSTYNRMMAYSEQIIDMYVNKLKSFKEIGDIFGGCSRTRTKIIKEILSKNNIKCRTCSEDSKIRVSNYGAPMKGHHHSQKAKDGVSKKNKGKQAWNKGLTKLTDERVRSYSEKSASKIRKRGECIYCGKVMDINNLKHYHNKNCKFNPENEHKNT